jgi:predicted nucleic acid-binding protein
VRVFIDSNIPMYVAGRDHPHRDPARRFLARVQGGEVEGVTSTEVLQEILYRYVGLRRRELAVEVYELFVGLCSAVLPVTLADTDRAKDMVRDGTEASVRDAVHAAVMLNNDLRLVATLDGGFDRIPDVERLALD